MPAYGREGCRIRFEFVLLSLPYSVIDFTCYRCPASPPFTIFRVSPRDVNVMLAMLCGLAVLPSLSRRIFQNLSQSQFAEGSKIPLVIVRAAAYIRRAVHEPNPWCRRRACLLCRRAAC